MNAYWTLIKIDIRLAFRQKIVLFFSYLMPLAFFLIFVKAYRAEQGGAILQVVTMVTVIGILGNGLMGAGIRAAQEREMNILRRYKVAPITALPLLVASSVTGLVLFLPYIVFMFAFARLHYGMALPRHMVSVLIFIVLALMALRALGLIVASVVNSMQESNILVQILYMSMLFLSGATIPTVMFPNWLLTVTQFIPATWLMTGLQGMMLRNETLWANRQAVGAMILTGAAGLFLSVKLFRWEKEEKMRPAAKLWLVAVLMPFLILGAWQTHAKDNVQKTLIINRELARSRTMLIRNARIFVGDGRVIENGAVLVKAGKIAAVYDGNIPDPKSMDADAVEAAGKTILPGLIDTDVHLSAPGGFYADWKNYDSGKALERRLIAYLYSGVTAVGSAGDDPGVALQVRARIGSGEKQGAELFAAGPVFTAAGGAGIEMLSNLPAKYRDPSKLTRIAKSASEVRQQVQTLSRQGVNEIDAVLEGGTAESPALRMDAGVLQAIVAQAHADHLPVIVQTGDERDVEEAMRVGADGIERGSMWRLIPDGDFAAMAKQGSTYAPALSVAEAVRAFADGKGDLLSRSLVQQVGPPALLEATRNALTSPEYATMRQALARSPIEPDLARGNLMRAYRAGVTLVAGSDAGNVFVFHGPSVQRELALWVAAGIPPQVALQAATLNAARALRAETRLGSIEKGKDATMLIVDGNPLQDIRALENISIVILKGERINRGERENGSELLKQE